MIKRLIRNIRQQPKSTRDGVAFAIASIFSLVVFLGWAVNTPDRLAAINESNETESIEAESLGSTLGDMFRGLKDQVASVVDSVPDPTNATSSAVATSSEQASSSLIMPNVEEVREQVRQRFDQASGTRATTTERLSNENNQSSGREVRIITTQSTSSASSTRP